MKLVIVAPEVYFKEGPGGIARYCREVYPKIESMLNTGDQIRKMPLGFDERSLATPSKLEGMGFALDADIIHNLAEAPFLPKRKRGVVVNTAHEFQTILYEDMIDILPKNENESLVFSIFKENIKSVLFGDYLIVNSSQTKEEAVTLGFEPENIYQVPMGIDRRFCETDPAEKEEGRKSFRLGWIGAIRGRKRADIAIGALDHIHNRVKLEMYGMVFRQYRKEFERLMNGNAKVEFRGFADDKKIVEIYDSFDAFLMPSAYEGFGLEILEAQARGIPVIAMKDSKIPEETKRYCVLADDTEDLAYKIDKILEMGFDQRKRTEAMKYAMSFTWEKTAEKTFESYKKMID